MNKEIKNIFFILLSCILFSILGVTIGYIIIKKNNLINKKDIVISDIKKIKQEDIKEDKIQQNLEKIKEDTKIIYESYYKDSDIKDYKESKAPYFMIGKNKEDLEKILPLWNVTAFNEKEVILKRNILKSDNQDYIIGIKDDYLAIFYGNIIDDNNLKEITNIPVEHLPKEEKLRLEEGIIVYGDEELSRRLEDYGS